MKSYRVTVHMWHTVSGIFIFFVVLVAMKIERFLREYKFSILYLNVVIIKY